MRRAIAAAVMGGLVLGGAVATPSAAAARGEGKAPGLKTVVYQGYEFQVPASWPVYRLDEHPQTCVRYDVHAVYLGPPGTNMRCPAGLVGRTQTVSFIPGTGAATGSPAGSASRPAASAAGGSKLQRLAAVHGTVTQNAGQHKLEVALGAAKPGAAVVGTYGSSPAVVEQVLNTLRLAPKGSTPTAQSVPASPVAPQRASAAPEAIWIALWDNVSSLSDGALTWPPAARAKQFAGNVNQTIGGITLNIDKDLVGGPMVGGPVAGLPGRFRQARGAQFARTAVDS